VTTFWHPTGSPFAALVVPGAAALALSRPFADHVPIFPVWAGEDWALSRTIWAAVVACSLAALAAVLLTPMIRRTPYGS